MPKFRLRGKVAPQSCVLEKLACEAHKPIARGAATCSLVGSNCYGVNVSTSSIPTLVEGDVAPHPWNGREGGRGGGRRRYPNDVHWKARVGREEGGERDGRRAGWE